MIKKTKCINIGNKVTFNIQEYSLYTNKECMAHHVTLLCLGEHIKVCTN